MHQILAYGNTAVAAGATLADIPAITDPNFSARGGSGGAAHWIFTEDYDLHAVAAFETTLTAAQLQDSLWNSINIPQIYPVNLGIVPASNPQVMDTRQFPMAIPQDEEIQFNASNALGSSTEASYGLLWIKPRGDTSTIPKPTLTNPRVKVLFTVTTVLTAGVWTADAVVTITNALKGGSYLVLGTTLVVAHALAYRVNFVRAPLYQGRKLQPGGLVENVYGNVPLMKGVDWLGPQGVFNNFELPKLAILGTTTETSATYTGYFDCIWLGPSMSNVAAPSTMQATQGY
jgi:hypothetical protein